MEFPTLVYRKGGKYQRPGGTYGTAPAADEKQLIGLMKDGWFLSLPEAINGKHDEVPENPEFENEEGPTREEMETKANEIGVKFSKKLGDENLMERIAAKLKEIAANEI